MSVAPAALNAAVAAVQVDVEVLGFLDHTNSSDGITTAILSLAAHTAISAADIDAMVVPHDSISHQARAVAALQQADAASGERHQLVGGSIGIIPHPRETQEKQHFEMPGPTQPPAMSARSPTLSSASKGESEMSTVSVPDTDPAAERSIAVMPSDFGLASASPHAICLCQAPTRIPRPRNAFILFRQHHHAAVVAQNPGKPNPLISKIIGQMWKGMSEEAKAVWQSHADEEKRQHLQRYPQYRYQPRRSGKKNAGASAFPDATSSASALESALCPSCGGLTSALQTPQGVSTPVAARRPSQPARNSVAAIEPADCSDSASPRPGTAGNGVAAGIQALLQLGLRSDEDELAHPSLNSSPKRRKLNQTTMPPPNSVPGPPPLQQGIYTAQLSDPNIDPYLQQDGFEHEPSSAALESEADMSGSHQLSHLGSSDIAVPVLKKVHAINKICPPISCPSALQFGEPAAARLPVISVDGDDVVLVSELFHALAAELQKMEPVYLLDEPDELTMLSEAYLEGLLSNTEPEKDKDTDDADAARYLSHVAMWRRKSSEIRRVVMVPPRQANQQQQQAPQDRFGAPQQQQQSRLTLINRYILSRSDVAAQRLSADGLSPLEHWQWCAAVWRSCVGPDMVIYVQALQEEEGAAIDDEDAVEAKDGGKVQFVRRAMGAKEWNVRVVEMLAQEINNLVRNLGGAFPG